MPLHHSTARRRAVSVVAGLAALAVTSVALAPAPASAAPTTAADDEIVGTVPGVDLPTATIEDLQAGLAAGDFTSVDLVEAYLERIAALDVGGPALNAIRELSDDALDQAAEADAARAAGEDLGPLAGVPILVKDNIDVAGLPTTAGSVALANSFPATDAPVTTAMEDAGAIILGKTNLSEFANFITNGLPSGYSSLGGQVLNAYDLSQTPSGSSSGSGVAASTTMAAATVGTETSGSILSPANANSLVGVKPTVGLISRTGIIPISASQDTAGPMTRTVYDAAALLSGMTTGLDPEDPATEAGAEYDGTDYTAGLDETALDGVRLGFVPSTNEPYLAALDVLRAQGAELVQVASPTNTTAPSILVREFERDLNAYLSRLPESAPMDTLSDIIAFNSANADVALKFGQTLLTESEAVDLDDPATLASYEADRDRGIAETRASIDSTLETNDVDAIVSNAATTGIGARAGYPSVTLPAGYNPANRRPTGITFLGTAFTEQALLEYAYDYEQAADVWRSPDVVNPTAFRCTAISEATLPDEDCPAAPVAPPATSVTLADLVANPVRQGQAPVVRVKVGAGDLTPVGFVRVEVPGRRWVRARLDDAGRATVRVNRPLAVGRTPLVVRYNGSPAVAPSQDRLVVRVRR
ncbi:hypothetical protein GCM10009737_05710 [Nocardioides lentus]|uniref:Amidase domain-containing protein n=1 Tax=Nocardioides lentus TaxID=338077 RepID=A0ABP5AAS2_9ACTN